MDTTLACGGCGAPLDVDQRYCLHCGLAQAEPRVAYRELIGAVSEADAWAPELAAPPFEAPTAVAVAPTQRDWTPVVALGGLAALALVLVVGVLIGRGDRSGSSVAAPPQVITVAAPAPAASAGATTTDTGAASRTGPKARHKKSAKGGSSKATAKALQGLQSTSGTDYQKKSAKLPDTVALPGKPPPKDNKAPGGGSGAQTIG